MSRWRPNATWLGKEASNLRQKERKSESHVVLEGSDVALEVQCDVARQGSEYFEAKGRKNVSHVVLGGSDVAMEAQHDVAQNVSWV